MLLESESLFEETIANKDNFEIKLESKFYKYKNGGDKNTITMKIILVDDEFLIRNSVRRVITKHCESLKENIDLTIIDANDGIECLIALYIANKNQIGITTIISDENMAYMNGSASSKIIQDVIINGKFEDIPMFISTAVTNNDYKGNYSKMVKQIFPKPIDKRCIKDIFKVCKQI